MSILKIILVPLSLILSLFVWLCAGLLSCSGFVFKLASGLLSLLAFADGTSAAGCTGAWQAARRERCHEKLHP